MSLINHISKYNKITNKYLKKKIYINIFNIEFKNKY